MKILKIRVPAYILDPKTLARYAKDFGIHCTDSENAPYDVEFAGPEDQLRTLLALDWEYTQTEIDEVIKLGEVA